MWERLEDIAEGQKIDPIDLIVHLLSKHEHFCFRAIAGDICCT